MARDIGNSLDRGHRGAKPALEIHAPHLVGRIRRRKWLAIRRGFAAMTPGMRQSFARQQLPDGAGRRPPGVRLMRLQPAPQLARSPPGMRSPQLQHGLLDRRCHLVGMPPRRPIAVRQTRHSILLPTPHNLVSRFAGDPVAVAQLRHRLHAGFPLQNKPYPLFHHSARFPHAAKCYPCPRSVLLPICPV